MRPLDWRSCLSPKIRMSKDNKIIPSLKEQQATARRLSAFQQKHTMEEAFLRSLLLQKEFMLKSLFI